MAKKIIRVIGFLFLGTLISQIIFFPFEYIDNQLHQSTTIPIHSQSAIVATYYNLSPDTKDNITSALSYGRGILAFVIMIFFIKRKKDGSNKMGLTET